MSYDNMLINDVLSAREDAEARAEALEEEMSWPPETDGDEEPQCWAQMARGRCGSCPGCHALDRAIEEAR